MIMGIDVFTIRDLILTANTEPPEEEDDDKSEQGT